MLKCNLNNLEMEVSAVSIKQYPPADLPEIALCGRSNVGKSSLINKLLGRRNFARTSSTPGKTATINFYNVDNTIRIVDLPGYGYAKRSNSEREKWAKMIEEYLSKRESLSAAIQLVDMRHKPSNDDVIMQNWIQEIGYAPIVVMTKHDKLKKSEITKNMQEIVTTLSLPEEAILIPFSAESGVGREEMLSLLQEIIEGVSDEPS
jgi:GTP-binding protein